VQLSVNYRFFHSDSSLQLIQQALQLANSNNFSKGKIWALNVYRETRRFWGEFPEALRAELDAVQISKSVQDLEGESISLG
jgi:hypothetical protein